MATAVLYEPNQFEPLIDEPWDPDRVEAAIAEIVADADAAFDPASLWPAHEWDEYREGQPMKVLYAGAAGVMLYGISLITAKVGTGYLPSVAKAGMLHSMSITVLLFASYADSVGASSLKVDLQPGW